MSSYNSYSIKLDNIHIYLETNDRKTYVYNLNEFPILACATKVQRDKFSLSPFGIHWPELDEDLSFEGLIKVKTA